MFEDRKQKIIEYFSNQTGPKVLIGHCEIVGGMVSDRYSLVGGQFEFTRGDLVQAGSHLNFLGHIHKHQVISLDSEKHHAEYVGALIQQNIKEEGNPTGVTIFEINQKAEYTVKKGELDSRKFLILDYDSETEPSLSGPFFPGDEIRIIPGDDEDQWRAAAAVFKKAGCIVSVRPRRSDLETTSTGATPSRRRHRHQSPAPPLQEVLETRRTKTSARRHHRRRQRTLRVCVGHIKRGASELIEAPL